MNTDWELGELKDELAFYRQRAVGYYNRIDELTIAIERTEANITDLRQQITELEARDG